MMNSDPFEGTAQSGGGCNMLVALYVWEHDDGAYDVREIVAMAQAMEGTHVRALGLNQHNAGGHKMPPRSPAGGRVVRSHWNRQDQRW